MPDYAEWLRQGLKKDGVSVEVVAASINLNRSALYKIMKGSRKMKLSEVPLIAAAINEPVPVETMIAGCLMVPLHGFVSATKWTKLKKVRGGAQLAMTMDAGAKSHCAFRVEGKCDPRLTTVQDGDDLACVGYTGSIPNNALVVVQRTIGKTEECVLRKVMQRGKRMYLQSIAKGAVASNAEPIHDKITILAVAQRLTRPI